jgi:hypothetical protein
VQASEAEEVSDASGIMDTWLTSPAPLWGLFRAILTRDGEGCARDGQPFYQCNYIWTDPRDGEILEILFSDGLWMLAARTDLEFRTAVP